MNLPLLNTVTNVYCDGIFDLLHRGHMEQFRQAHDCVPGGTRLFVGVCVRESTYSTYLIFMFSVYHGIYFTTNLEGPYALGANSYTLNMNIR